MQCSLIVPQKSVQYQQRLTFIPVKVAIRLIVMLNMGIVTNGVVVTPKNNFASETSADDPVFNPSRFKQQVLTNLLFISKYTNLR